MHLVPAKGNTHMRLPHHEITGLELGLEMPVTPPQIR